MRILVTGSNGQIGNELVLLSMHSNHDWLCLDRKGLDVTQYIDVNRIVDDFSPDVVINATAYTAVDKAESEQHLASAVNTDAARYLAQACERNNAVLLHISTDYVFPGDSIEPYKEQDPVAPSCHYGASKLAGEYEVSQHCSKHIILRTSWVFGQHGNNFVKTMVHLAKGRDTFSVVSDQFGAPTSANGIANALLNIAEQVVAGNYAWGIYHFCGTPYTSWHGFAELIFSKVEKLQMLPNSITVDAITTSDYPTPAKRPANTCLDCSKIKSTFGIPTDDWQNQLSAVLNSIE